MCNVAGNEKEFKRLVLNGVDINGADEEGNSALLLAVKKSNDCWWIQNLVTFNHKFKNIVLRLKSYLKIFKLNFQFIDNFWYNLKHSNRIKEQQVSQFYRIRKYGEAVNWKWGWP